MVCTVFSVNYVAFMGVTDDWMDDLRIGIGMCTLKMRWLGKKTWDVIILGIQTGWWFGSFYIFPYIRNNIIPTDELHDFSEG